MDTLALYEYSGIGSKAKMQTNFSRVGHYSTLPSAQSEADFWLRHNWKVRIIRVNETFYLLVHKKSGVKY